MGHKGKPRLKKECDNAGPIEYKTRSKMRLHIMPPNVVHNEWKGMQERKDKKGIGYPSVKDLESLIRNSGKQCNPICLARSGTRHH